MSVYPSTTTLLSSLAALGPYLDDVGVRHIADSFLYMPFCFRDLRRFLRTHIATFPVRARPVIRLLMLSECVRHEELRHAGFDAFLPALADAHMVVPTEEGIQSNGIHCEIVNGCYIFVSDEQPGQEILAYFGDDSIALSRHLSVRQGQRVLDVCCGSGIQSILSAKQGARVWGVDIQPEVLDLARLNAALNGVAASTTFVACDIRQFRPRDSFDVVIANPPLLPIADDVPYPLCGAGGESGLEITREIVRVYQEHGAPGGIGLIIGTCLGGERRAEVEPWLRSLLTESDEALVLLLARMSAAQLAEGISRSAQFVFGADPVASSRRMLALCAQRGAGYAYSFLLRLHKQSQHPGVQVVRLCECSQRQRLWYVA